MTSDAIVKYAGAALLLGSLFYLTLVGSMQAGEYVGIVTGALSALGIYHATKPAASDGAKS